MKFEFVLESADAVRLCQGIVAELVRLYGLTEGEAVERISDHWRGRRLGKPENDVVFHEDETFWAKNSYYRGEIPREELD